MWDARTKRTITLVIFVLGLLAVLWLGAVLPILIVASVLAYLLYPLATTIDRVVLSSGPLRERSTRGLAVMLSFLLVVAFFVVIVIVIVPVMVGQLEEFGRNAPGLLNDLAQEIERVLSEPLMFRGNPILIDGEPVIPLERLAEATGTQDISSLLQLENLDLVGAAQTFLGSLGVVTGPAFSFLGGAINTLINLSFLLVMLFYLMKDGERFVKALVDITPELYQSDARRLFYELAEVWNAYLRGQIILGLVMGSAVFTAATLLGVPNPAILGLLSGLLEFIPNLGPFLALIPAMFLALVSQSSTLPFLEGVPFAIVVIVAWSGLQNIEALILVPRVMGGSLDLHPFVVIVAVIGGASVAGALGIILAAPFVASARVIGLYIYGKLTDSDPFPRRQQTRAGPELPAWLQRLWATLGHHLPALSRRVISEPSE
jgi:predicted PurR-regulated permease PerM